MFKLCESCECDNITCPKNKNKKILYITLNITDKCLNNCDYCWHKKHERVMMYRTDITKLNIDNLINLIKKKYKKYNIVFLFMGGEPTLKSDIINYAIDELRKIKNNYFLEIYTHINTNLIDFEYLLNKYSNIKSYISLDNKNLDSIDLSFYKKYQTNKKFIYSLVITEYNYFNIEKILMFYYNNGINNINLLFDINGFSFDEKILEKELIKIKNSNKINILNFNTRNSKPLYKNIFVDFFSNEKFYLSHFSETEGVGDIDQGIDENKISKIELECKKCEYNNICQINKSIFLDKKLNLVIDEKVCKPYKILYRIKRGY